MKSGIKAPDSPAPSDEAEAPAKASPSVNAPLRLVSIQPSPNSSPELPVEDETILPTLRPPAPDLTDPYIGCIIDGRYKVDSIIGEGGMGVVYGCKHKLIEKRVAIKILRSDLARDPEVTGRFLNEARSASAIGNPHIIDISDFGILPDGSTYFVMEFLDGQPLSNLIASLGTVPVPRLLHIARQLAEGLAAAHHASIVHRDLKPDNIFLVSHGAEHDFVKILDFGIAKVSSAEGRITRAGTIFGTPHYMAPEQAAGNPVDHRGDIYSFGVILYEMISGRLPFDADTFMAILSQHMYKAPTPFGMLTPPLAEPVAAALEAVILKCLSKRPENRYQSIDELGEELDRFCNGEVPNAVAELEARGAEYDAPPGYFARDGLPANTDALQPKRPMLTRYLGMGAVFIAVGILSALIANRNSPTTPPVRPVPSQTVPTAVATPSAPSTLTAPEGPAPVPSAEEAILRDVAIAVEPIEAEVFSEGKSLGKSPVIVKVTEGHPVALELRLAGYRSQSITLDGSEGRVSIKLTRNVTTNPRGGRPPRPRHPTVGGAEMAYPWATK